MGFELPAAGFMSDAARTEGEIKTGLDQMVGHAKQTLGGGKQTAFTIVSGVITPTSPWINVDTEGAASVDDLDQIATTNFVEGNIIFVFLANAAHHVVMKSNVGSDGSIITDRSGADVKLTDTAGGLVLLLFDSGGGVLKWTVIDRWASRGTERFQSQRFTSSDNFTVPSMINQIFTMGVGSGGGGGEGGDATNDGADGTVGNDTILAGRVTYSGGAVGKGGKAESNGGQGGQAGAGGHHGQPGVPANNPGFGGSFAASIYGEAGAGAFGGDGAAGTEGGGGGSGGPSRASRAFDGPFAVTPGDMIAVTIGAVSAGGSGGGSGQDGSSSIPGELTIFW